MSNLKTTASRTPEDLAAFSPPIDRLLTRLRTAIRRYIVWEGLAKLICWLLLAFWVSFAFDYLPVLFGYRELSVASRTVVLVVTGVGAIWIVYHFIVSRIVVRLKNESISILVERKYPVFNGSLITSVTPWEQDSTSKVKSQMREHTRHVAETILSQVEVSSILNFPALKRNLLWAGLFCLSVFGLAVMKPAVTQLAAQRLYRLDSTSWPRRCQIELVGIKIARQNPVPGIRELGIEIEPVDHEFKITRGASVTLLVRAKANLATESTASRFPENCRVYYENSEGSRGSARMKRIGSPRDGFQLFAFDLKPFATVMSDIRFEIRGGDHCIGPFDLILVDEPAVVSTSLACQFPRYMEDAESGRWTPREIPWAGFMELPQGTSVIVRSAANKPLRKVYSFDVLDQQMEVLEVDSNMFEISIQFLSQPINREIYLCDDDGLISEQPFSLSITPIDDQPPTVQTEINGIGIAITSNAMIPVRGMIKDDYGVARAWIEVAVSDDGPLQQVLDVGSNGKIDSVIDFLELRRMPGRQVELSTDPGSSISLTVKAEDRFDLAEQPNRGLGDKITLDVVDDSELLRILERKEVAERRRLEQVYQEMIDARGYLIRTSGSYVQEPSLEEPGEQLETTGLQGNSVDAIQGLDVRLLLARRAIMQIDKSAQEIMGIAAAFENIRLQLINNRIDSADRKLRIEAQVEEPLRAVADPALQELRNLVVKLEANLTGLEQDFDKTLNAEAELTTDLAITRADEILIELNRVLDSLIKYETQNELLEIVRQLIKQQEAIMENTKRERQRKAFEGLLD